MLRCVPTLELFSELSISFLECVRNAGRPLPDYCGLLARGQQLAACVCSHSAFYSSAALKIIIVAKGFSGY